MSEMAQSSPHISDVGGNKKILRSPESATWKFVAMCEGWIKNQLATAKAQECRTKAWIKYAAEEMKSEA